MIHVCYSIQDKTGTYCRVLATSIISLLLNTSSYIVCHIFHDSTLSDATKIMLKNMVDKLNLVKSKNNIIQFYNLDSIIPTKIAIIKNIYPNIERVRFGIASIYRLFIKDILGNNIEKCIYLDADTVVNLDIEYLWNEYTGRNGLAAVPEISLTHGYMVPKYLCNVGKVKYEDYFNSGVLLLNFNYFTIDDNILLHVFKMLATNPQINCLDQDILNYFYSDSYNKLPIHYNVFPDAERLLPKDKQYTMKGIYHYAGNAQKLFPHKEFYNNLFLHYFSLTPLYDQKFLYDMLSKYESFLSYKYNIFYRIIELAGRKNRIFCAELNFKDKICEFFNMKNDICIPINIIGGKIYMKEINYEMKRRCGKFFFIFYTNLYNYIKIHLVNNGFVEYEDFIDGTILIGLDKPLPFL